MPGRDDIAKPDCPPTQSFSGLPYPAAGAGAQAGLAPTPSLIGRSIGAYRVLRELGRGGMGIVYEAAHESLPQRAAVKVLRPDSFRDPAAVQRFHTEARAATIADHPGLVKIFDSGQLPTGELYILMEYLEGEPLSRRLTARQPLALAETLRLIRQIAAAMAIAHERGIYHRDLKPDNLFLIADAAAEGGERIKILDFGLARIAAPRASSPVEAAAERNTVGTVIMGTPAYMSPEQCRGLGDTDGRTDVYALGVILYEMLSGRRPFGGDSLADQMAAHLLQEPPALRSVAPDTPPELAALAHRMLSKAPEARPSMRQIVVEISQIHADGPSAVRVVVSLPPEPGPRRARRRAWKRTAAAASGVLALVASALLGPRLLLLPQVRTEMVRLPGGVFTLGSSPYEIAAALSFCQQLGSEGCDKARFQREHPPHPVTLSPYFLDTTEVDNEHFAAWLNTQRGLRVDAERLYVYAGETLLADLYSTYGNGGIVYREGRFQVLSGYGRRPVTQITWDAAGAYCQAQGKRLPTEAEWELAARGAQGFRFPWGDVEPRCEGTVFGRSKGGACGHLPLGPQDVGTSAQDRSPQRIHDLAGNVSEWVADRFVEPGYYPSCAEPCLDPVVTAGGPPGSDELRVVRGGDWFSPAWLARSSGRSRVRRSLGSPNVGFRCARAAVP